MSVQTEMKKQEFQNSKQNCNIEQTILRDDSLILVQGTQCGHPVNAVLLHSYTGCNRRNRPGFGRVFLRSYYTDITQNTYTQSSMVTEILAREV